jgi:uncharacterized repeat protein (TIGR03833 family)
MRDVRRRDHLAPGLQVKIVPPEDEATGLTVEGEIAEIVGPEPFDPDGIVVRLASGQVGRVLRVWEGGRARELPLPEEPAGRAPSLPSYAEPRPAPYHHQFRISDKELQAKTKEALGGANAGELDRMIAHHEEGLEAPLLRRFGIRSDELAQKSADLLRDVDDDELARKLRGGPEPDDDERD